MWATHRATAPCIGFWLIEGQSPQNRERCVRGSRVWRNVFGVHQVTVVGFGYEGDADDDVLVIDLQPTRWGGHPHESRWLEGRFDTNALQVSVRFGDAGEEQVDRTLAHGGEVLTHGGQLGREEFGPFEVVVADDRHVVRHTQTQSAKPRMVPMVITLLVLTTAVGCSGRPKRLRTPSRVMAASDSSLTTRCGSVSNPSA